MRIWLKEDSNSRKWERRPLILEKLSFRELHDSKLSSLRNLDKNLLYSFSNNFKRNPSWRVPYLIDTQIYVCLKK